MTSGSRRRTARATSSRRQRVPGTPSYRSTTLPIADATGLELTVVRDFLDNADGVKFAVEREGDTRTVTALLTD